MATLRNVDDIGVAGCERERAHQNGEALLLRKQEFSRTSIISPCQKACASFTCSHALEKKTCVMKNFNHTQRSREHAMKPGCQSPTFSDCQLPARHGRLICPSFPLLEYFKENPRHHVISPSCTSVCIKKISTPPSIFRTWC